MPSYCNSVGLMIAVPHAGRAIVPEWGWCFANLHPPMNYNTRYANIFGQPVDTARNFLAGEAIKQECKYLFFLGDDVTCPGHTIRQLIYFMENNPDCAVVGGIYCQKTDIHPAPLVFRGNGRGSYWDWKVGEVFEVSGIGMDVTLIRVDALKSLPQPWFKTVDDASGFTDAVNKSETWTEDLYFCKKVTDAGWKIYADGSILCEHWDAQQHRAYRLDADSKPFKKENRQSSGLKIVDLGCGQNKLKTDEGDVIGVDIRELPGVDYRADLHCLPFATGEFDIVFSSHTLEHFSREETDRVLDEWIRVLKPGGEFRIVVPNIAWVANQLVDLVQPDDLQNPTQTGFTLEGDILNVLYGSQEYEQNFHKNGFWPERLKALLSKRGFTRIEIDDAQYYNLVARAWRETPKAAKRIKK